MYRSGKVRRAVRVSVGDEERYSAVVRIGAEVMIMARKGAAVGLGLGKAGGGNRVRVVRERMIRAGRLVRVLVGRPKVLVRVRRGGCCYWACWVKRAVVTVV